MARGSAKLGGRGRGRAGSAEGVPELGDTPDAAPSPARNILPGEPFEPAPTSFGHGPDPHLASGWGVSGPEFNTQAPLTWGTDPSTAPLTAVGAGHPGPGGADPLDALQQYAGLPLGAGYGAAPAPDPSQVYQGYGSAPADSGFAGGGLFSGEDPVAEPQPTAYVPHPAGPADGRPEPVPAAFAQPAAQPFEGQAFEGQAFEGQPFAGQPFQPQPFQPQAFESQPFESQPFEGQPFGGQAYGGQPFPSQPTEGQAFAGQPVEGPAFGGQPFDNQPFENQPYGQQQYGAPAFGEQAQQAQPFPTAPTAPGAFPGVFDGADQTRAVDQLPGGAAAPLDVTPSSTVVPGSMFDGAHDEKPGRARGRRRSPGRRSRDAGHRPTDVEHRSDLGLEAFTGPEAGARPSGARRGIAVLGAVAVLGAAGFIGYTQLSGTDDSLSAGPPVAAAKPASARYPLPSSLGTNGQIPADQAKALKASWTALAKMTLPDLPPPLVVSAYGPAGAKPTTNVVVYASGPQAKATFEALISSLSRPSEGSSATVAKPAGAGTAGGQVMCGSQAGKAPSAWCAFTSPKGVGFVHVDGTAKAEDAAAATRELRAFAER